MLKLVKILLLFAIGLLLLGVAVALASNTGVVEWAALLAVGALLVFAASRVWRIGDVSRAPDRA